MRQTPLRLCQRWRTTRATYRPAGEPIDPERYTVGPLDEAPARDFVVEHHYSRSYPAARCRVGLWHQRRFERPRLVGVAVYSVPMQKRVVPRWLGVEPAEGVELGRFVLLDEVPANGESWFLARAARELRAAKPEVRAVVSYSDPVPRETAAGAEVMPGHVGTIYQAHNARLLGRSKAGRLLLDPDGRVMSRRALTKLRNGETGARYAYEKLVAMGAPPIRRGEPAPAYVRRALAEGPFRVLRHPGNHVYGWALCKRVKLPPAAGPYPKTVEPIGQIAGVAP